MPTTDLLIIGAGPAGLSTALHLLQIDPAWKDRLIVLDKAAHPRHKLCGGGVTLLGLNLLKGLGLPDPLPLPHAAVHDARFIYRRRTIHVRGAPEFLVFHRAEFDAYLAQTARQRGIQLHENQAVTTIRRTPEGFTITTPKREYHARLVVGADGSKGITRRYVGGRFRPSRVARLLEVVTPAPEDAPPFRQRFARFDFTPTRARLQGYVWDFPARVQGIPHHNRGVYDARIARKRGKASLPRILQQSLQQSNTDPQKVDIEGHPIHLFSPRNPFADHRILLVGDAAGADPLFGEGIAPALGYGKIAAQSIHRAFVRNDFSLKDYHRRVLFSRLGVYLLLRWGVAWWSYRLSGQPWFMHTVWTIGQGLAALKKTQI